MKDPVERKVLPVHMISPSLRIIVGILGGCSGISLLVMLFTVPFPEKLICLGIAWMTYIFLSAAVTGHDAPIGDSASFLDVKDYLERTFQTSLSFEELADTNTPHRLIQLILRKIAIGEHPSCISARAFYMLRKMLVEDFHVSRAVITPHADLNGLIPRKQRQMFWKRCHALMDSHVPFPWGLSSLHVPSALERPVWYSGIIGSIVGGLAIIILLVSQEYFLLFGVVVGMGSVIIAMLPIIRSYQYVLPEEYHRMTHLTYHLIVTRPEYFRREHDTWSLPEIQTVIKALILDMSHRDNYNGHWNFAEDFGLMLL